MAIFLHILGHNIVPIFTMIVLGWILSQRFNIDVRTLSKLNLYLFAPAFVFVNLYTTNINLNMLKVLVFAILFMIVTDFIGRLIAKIRRYDTGMANAFKNSVMFNNSGNIGLSLIILVFTSFPFVVDGKTPYLNEAIAAQIIILVFQNITSNTIGFYNAARANLDTKDSLLRVLSLPSVYAVPTAFLLKGINFDLPATIIWPPLVYLKDAMIPIVLITLGAQLSKTKFTFGGLDVHISVFTRLILGPIMAVIFIKLFGFNGVVAQTLFIGYSVPTAVNTALVAVECGSYEDFASRTVMVSTIYSCVTLTLAIYIARIVYPV